MERGLGGGQKRNLGKEKPIFVIKISFIIYHSFMLLLRLFVLVLLAYYLSSCAKPCRVSGCRMIHDHVHFFGGERGDGRPITREEALKEGELKVVSGMPWYRRLFKKTYVTENGLKHKRFNPHQHRARNKEDWHTLSGKAKYPGKEGKTTFK